MSARIFLHPRCATGPAAGALEAHLVGAGYNMREIAVFYEHPRRRYELVRRVNETGVIQRLARMDGTEFTHRMGIVTNEGPEAA